MIKREMRTKATMNCHLTSVRLAITLQVRTLQVESHNLSEDVETLGSSCIQGEDEDGVAVVENICFSLSFLNRFTPTTIPTCVVEKIASDICIFLV